MIQVDRILRGAVMDRRAIVFTSIQSSQVVDNEFSTQVDQLGFDIEGHAPRLDLKGKET
jgi:hypothetical protein